MEKLTKYKKHILMSALIVAGVLCVVLGKNNIIRGGVACLFLGLSVLVMTWITSDNQNKALNEYDKYAKDILIDIANKGEESEYYSMFNIEILNNIKFDIEKKYKRQIIGCFALSAVLFVIAAVCII